MPWKIPLRIAGLCALLVSACQFPGGDCACTDMYCLEGVIVELKDLPDSEAGTGVALSLAYGDTVEPEDTRTGFGSRQRRIFTSRRLVSQKPESIRLRLDARAGASDLLFTLDTVVAWKSNVCNQCSGSAPHCKDDMAHTAGLTWDLPPAPLPAAQGGDAPPAEAAQEVAVPVRQQDE